MIRSDCPLHFLVLLHLYHIQKVMTSLNHSSVPKPSINLIHRFNDLANKISSNKCDFNSVNTIAPGPLERTCWRQFEAL